MAVRRHDPRPRAAHRREVDPPDLQLLHELGSWVITVDRYAGRDALENALGNEVAILHQERRLASDNIQSLVISQKSGRSTDRAIAEACAMQSSSRMMPPRSA